MALAGDHVIVKMGPVNDTQQFADGDIISVDLGQSVDQHDVTGFGDAVHRFINGQLRTPVTLKGYVTTATPAGTHTVIQSAFAAGTTMELEVQVGNNATPTEGDPMYSGEFLVSSYMPVISTGGAVTFTATLVPATGDAPVWDVIPAP